MIFITLVDGMPELTSGYFRTMGLTKFTYPITSSLEVSHVE